MDKIREEESIIEELESIYYNEYTVNLLSELKDGIVFKNKKIEKLNQDCKNLIERNNNQQKELDKAVQDEKGKWVTSMIRIRDIITLEEKKK